MAGGGVVLACSYRCVTGCEGDAFGHYRGVLIALDAATGADRWTLPATGSLAPPWTAEAVAGGLVFVASFRDGPGRIAAASVRTGKVLWTEWIGGSVFAGVDAVARGNIYATTAFGWHDPKGGTLTVYRLPGT